MSFGWPSSATGPVTGLRPTFSFADALRRLAEHVEEKNRMKENNDRASPPHSSAENLAASTPKNESNAPSTEQALRMYSQCLQQMEQREDMRKAYGRAAPGSGPDNPSLHRRVDMPEPYRFLIPPLSTLIPPPTSLPSSPSATRLPFPSGLFFSHPRNNESSNQTFKEQMDDRKSEISTQTSKPPLKLFRPYKLDGPETKSLQRSSYSTMKKLTPSTSTFSTNIVSSIEDIQPPSLSSGKEKQLFNSLGLAQTSADHVSEAVSITSDPSQSSPPVSTSEDTSSKSDLESEKSSSEEKNDARSITLKRKSIFSYPNPNRTASHRKQFKAKRIPSKVE